jgi:hypothetical protein
MALPLLLEFYVNPIENQVQPNLADSTPLASRVCPTQALTLPARRQ